MANVCIADIAWVLFIFSALQAALQSISRVLTGKTCLKHAQTYGNAPEVTSKSRIASQQRMLRCSVFEICHWTFTQQYIAAGSADETL